MTATLILARLVLAAVFGVAALAKAADRSGSSSAMRDFGVPAWLAPTVGWLLPLAEGAVSVALLPALTAWWGGVGALFLLGVFLTGIAYNIARGRAPDCHCFGQLRSEPVGWPTFIRNVVFAGLAGLIVSTGPHGPQPSMVALAAQLTIAHVALLASVSTMAGAIMIGAWFLGHLFAQHGRVLARLDALENELESRGTQSPAPKMPTVAVPAPQGLPLGAPAPSFALPDLTGQIVSLAALLRGAKPVLMLFVDPGCGPCTALVPEAVGWRREHAERFQLVLLSRGSAWDNRIKFASTGLGPVLLEDEYEISARYSALGTPSAVLVRPDGRIGSAVAGGCEAIRALVSSAAAARVQAPAVLNRTGAAMVGAAAPPVRLSDIAGRTRTLQEFLGHDTLVLFWNPSCGYCARMLDDVKRWEASAGPASPRLVLVSTGEPDANRALGLRSPILLDAAFGVAPTFGVHGTPSAVLVDAEGRIASAPALGAQPVLALAGPLEIAPR